MYRLAPSKNLTFTVKLIINLTWRVSNLAHLSRQTFNILPQKSYENQVFFRTFFTKKTILVNVKNSKFILIF